MPSARASARGVTNSATPKAMENRPSPRANLSVAESGWPRRREPSLSYRMPSLLSVVRVAAKRTPASPGALWSRSDRHLDAAALLVAEGLVHLWAVLKADRMGDYERGVDLAFLNAAQEVVGPAVHVRLAGPDGQALVHHHAHRELSAPPAIDARHRQDAGRTADV